MERNVSIYMFDREKAARNLYKDLKQRFYTTSTFKNHIENSIENSNMNFDEVLEAVKNDVNMIHPNNLNEITHFFKGQIYPLFAHDSLATREEYLTTLYDYLGITKLYELDTTNASKAYTYLYEMYIDYCPINEIRGESFSTSIPSEDFLKFNDFVILLTKRTFDSKLCDYTEDLTEEEEFIIEKVRLENQQNIPLSEAIEDQITFFIKVFFPDDRQDFIQAIYHAPVFLKQAIKIRSMIDVQKNPRIIVVGHY